jgi:quercetin dioxygenase-like cupin family protein
LEKEHEMARIEFSSPEAEPFRRTGDFVPDDFAAKLSSGELDSEVRFHHPGDADRLQMFEIRAPADAVFNAHSHDEDEIILVAEGELHAGSHVVGPGGSMYVQGGTVYGFRAGPEGLRFFNVRPRFDGSFHTRAELRPSK